MPVHEVDAAISADSGLGSAGIPYVGPAQFPAAEDFSGNGYTGTMNANMSQANVVLDSPGGAFSTRCLEFSGSPNTNKYVGFGDVLAFEQNQPFSFSLWVKHTYADLQTVIGKAPRDGTLKGYILMIGSYIQLEIAVDHNGGNRMAVSGGGTPSLSDGAWHHVVVSYDGSSVASGVKMYTDGTLRTSSLNFGTLSAGTIISTTPLEVPWYNSGGSMFTGKVDDVAIYDKVLSAGEVMTVYNSGAPNDLRGGGAPSNLVGYWRFGEATHTDYTTELQGIYALAANPTADSLCSSSAWMGWGAYAICGAEASLGADSTVAYAVDAGILADSLESCNAGVNYAIDSSVFADSDQTAWVFADWTLVAGCMADSACSGAPTMDYACWAAMPATSGLVCPGFDKVHHATPSPNPPPVKVPKVRTVPQAPPPPSYGLPSGARRVYAPAVQTPIRKPT